ncbi:TPA: hypothetical protein ACIJ20_005688 [Pseudomonas aeruginosa]|uniref:hypothetical protein n=1 Tax=Pseudomonas TaxID=286 RepID=UPI000341212F|nr:MULTISPECIES: hypothetical protein [Pseudomonas]HCL2910851.1 hypothetical protein [Pseudomonas aeruginosa 059A]ALP58379.1 hypothetical protein ATC05_15740 [Pseudomonas aeruginosa]EIU7138653.1 hypothetical protein [Pseudomonas aeruginosa]EIX9399641.1 hypothetical protein [Pseudomonas aeruginosa]EKQ6385452.1 hypothetical protein [Pseudomonas aeruginosa]
MAGYSHQVSAVFNLRAQAESARKRLVDRGLGLEQLSILGAEDVPLPTTRRRSFIQVLSSGAAGALAGLLVSTLVTFALTRTEASLFGDAPLALLGWSSALGALFGGAVGASVDVSQVSGPFRQAIAQGHVVLLANTRSEIESLLVRDVIESSVGVGVHMDISLV